MQEKLAERSYQNAGNPDVVALIPPSALRVLDVGCGAGDNAALLRARNPLVRVDGITASPFEAAQARQHMQDCWIADLEGELPSEIAERQYDAILCSHVLEHLREPSKLVARLEGLLGTAGVLAIAVPNVLNWRDRAAFLAGRFEYQSGGTLDDTHLRFFTFETADRYLLAQTKSLTLDYKGVTGSVPLWFLRHHVLSQRMKARIDIWGCRVRPNLFGAQVVFRAAKHALQDEAH